MRASAEPARDGLGPQVCPPDDHSQPTALNHISDVAAGPQFQATLHATVGRLRGAGLRELALLLDIGSPVAAKPIDAKASGPTRSAAGVKSKACFGCPMLRAVPLSRGPPQERIAGTVTLLFHHQQPYVRTLRPSQRREA